jgi:hypothetical protein
MSDARTERIKRVRTARAAQESAEAETAVRGTLGDALFECLAKLLRRPHSDTMPLARAMAMAGYSDELKRLIVRSIETNPAMEETFLLIAELAFADGEEEAEENHRADTDYSY